MRTTTHDQNNRPQAAIHVDLDGASHIFRSRGWDYQKDSDPETNDWLNKRLGRTEFMPFAPVAMFDKADMLFEDIRGKEHACKFMTIVVN